jgi:hypothetical protein
MLEMAAVFARLECDQRSGKHGVLRLDAVMGLPSADSLAGRLSLRVMV